MTARRRLGWVVGAVGCARTEHLPVDLHVDILAAPPASAATVRLCNEGGIAEEYGATLVGTYVLTGLFADLAPVVTVDAIDEAGAWLGRAGPVVVDAPYVTTGWSSACIGDGCVPCSGCTLGEPSPGWPSCSEGQTPAQGAPDAVLGVRFADPMVSQSSPSRRSP